jgi:putative (di)nucleoside polyphosphate hydrolase
MSDLPYRACVGICLINGDGQIFVGRRKDKIGAEAWQMPQGGIDKDEDLHVAARRELREEIGTDKMDIIALHPDKLRYDLPKELIGRVIKGYRGQEQQWVYARFTGVDSDIDLDADDHPEFVEWRWVEPAEILDYVVPFKRDVYEAVLAALPKA